jgi:hypothetical protein
MKKIYLLLLAVMMLAVGSYAQVSSYSFSQRVGTYTPVTGGTVVHATGWDDAIAPATIPFSFTVNGVAYTTLSVNTNGYVTFGVTTSATNGYSPISATTGYAASIAAFGRDLISTGGTIEYATVGSAPNRQFVIQWNNALRYNGGAVSGDVLNFQIVLNEANGVALNQKINIIYGTCTATNTTALTAQIGLRGALSTDFNNRSTAVDWLTTTFGTSNGASCSSLNTIMPVSGLAYTYTPTGPCIAPNEQPTALTLTPVIGTQINGSFTPAATPPAPDAYLVVRYLTGATPTNPVNGTSYAVGGALGTGIIVQSNNPNITFIATGLTASTAYDFYVYSENYFCTTGSPVYYTPTPLTATAITPGSSLPLCPTTFTPLSAAVGSPVSQVLSWSGALGFPAITGYNVYLSTNSALVASEDVSVRVSANQAGTTFTPLIGTISYNTTYYWKITPINSMGTSTGCAVNSFTTYVPSGITSTALGGLWSSPATWAGGVVPIAGDNVTIVDGAIVTGDVATPALNSLTIGQGTSGILQFNATTYTAPIVAVTVSGNITVSAGAKLIQYSSGGTGQAINVGGDFINNGFVNAAIGTISFNGSQQAGGSLAQNLTGTGTFVGDGTNGFIRVLFFQTTGSSSITTTQNLVTTSAFAHTAGSLNTNGKLSLNNTAQVYGQALNTQVASIAVTAMGSGYTSAPIVFGATTSPWVASAAAVVGTRYFSGGNVYICTTAGAFDATTAPTHTSGIVANGAASLLWLAPIGTLGNPFILTAAVVGTQYFYGGNLYVCTVAGVPSTSAPPVHTTGTATSGAATYLYVGTPATVSVNYDAVTSTVRSLNITNPGSGYSSSPSTTFNAAVGSGAAASSIVIQGIAGVASLLSQKSGSSTISGVLNINSNQSASAYSGIGGITTSNGGVNYTVAPLVGFAGPTAINLVTAAGSGFTTAPTITVTGGTLVSGTALATGNFTITVNQGKVVSVYLNASTTATYSVPPTLAFTGGAGAGATLAFPAGCWPAATAVIGTNRQLTNFNITNAGFGYTLAPTLGVGTTSGTAAGGTYTTVATAPTCRIALYNLVINNFAPSASNLPNADDAIIPTNRKLNVITLGSTTPIIGNLSLTSNIELFNTAPLVINAGSLNMGGATLLCSNSVYLGLTGSSTANVTNGSITLTERGGGSAGLTLNYPFDPTFTTFIGTAATVAAGSNITALTVSRTAAPSGTSSPSGVATGTRAYRAVTNAGAVYGTAPTVTMNYNAIDAIAGDNAQIFIGQSAALTGAWTNRSVAAAAGALPATGFRTTGTTLPNLIVPTGDDYYAWVGPPPCTGTPAPGNTLSTNLSPCIGTTITLSLQNPLAGTPGITYQWYSSPDGITYTPISAATSFTYTTPAISAITYFKADVICSFSSSTGTSVAVTINPTNCEFNVTRTTGNAYTSIMSSGNTYTTWSGGSFPADDEFTNTVALTGTTFKYNAKAVTGFWASTNGFISFNGALKAAAAANDLTSTSLNQVIAPFWDDLVLKGSLVANHDACMRYKINGTLGSGTADIIIEWADLERYLFGPPNINFQIVLHEAGNTIDFNYGNMQLFDGSLNNTILFSYSTGINQANPALANLSDRMILARENTSYFTTTNQTSLNLSPTCYSRLSFVPGTYVGTDPGAPGIPTNDETAGAITVAVNSAPCTSLCGNIYISKNATATAAITACSAATPGTADDDVWFKFTTSSAPQFKIDVTPSLNYDAVVQLLDASFAPVACVNTGGIGIGETMTNTLTASTVYYVRIYHAGATIGTSNGEFAICVSEVIPPPTNDECIGATTLAINATCVATNSELPATLAATASAGVPVCSASTPGTADDDVWYKFTTDATVGANYVVTVQGFGTYNPVLQVLSGGCATLAAVACLNATGNGGIETYSTTALTPGTVYYIRVYHAGTGAANGNFSICITKPLPSCVNTPAPANLTTSCGTTTATVLSWVASALATSYDVYFDAGAGPATSIVSTSQVGLTYNAGILTAGQYTWKVVAKNSNGASTGCSDFTFTVTALPAVSVSPAGPIAICAPATQTLTGTTSASTPSFQWLNNNAPIASATAISYIATSTGSYRLKVTDGVTGCTDTSIAVIVTVTVAPVFSVSPVTYASVCDTVKIDATTLFGIKITEVTLFNSGTGSTSPYPSYASAGSDFVEISNVSSIPVNVGGYTLADYASASSTAVHPYTIPSGTIIPANGVMVINLASGTDDIPNRYFNTGGSENWSSGQLMGVVLKNGATIIDAVGLNSGYTFDPATGVTAADWSGFAPSLGGFAGTIRTTSADNNNGSDWSQSNSSSPVQSIGTYNGGFIGNVIPLPVSWLPVTNLFTDMLLTTPYVSGNVSTVYAKPGMTTTYTATATNGSCSSTATSVITVTPLTTLEWTGNVSTDWANAGNWKCGIIPTTNSVVLIPAGRPNYPVTTSNVEIKTLTVATGASVTTGPGFELKLNGM